MTMIIALTTETCVSCGAQNRWWVSRKGYNQEFINWTETGLCPRCHDPKEVSDV